MIKWVAFEMFLFSPCAPRCPVNAEAERKACDDEGSETIKANQQRLNRLKLDGKPQLIDFLPGGNF